MIKNQEVLDKIIRAKIRMQQSKPFFAYLLLNLNIIETPKIPTCAVDNHRNLYYNPNWVGTLNERQLSGLLCHELLHCVFEHLIRNETRDKLLFNCACDIVVNNLLIMNDFELPIGGIIPSNNEIDFCGVHISGIDKKSAENVYDELHGKFKKTQANMKMAADMQLDEHIKDDIKKLENGTKDEQGLAKQIKEVSKMWKKMAVEAESYARTIGKSPKGISRHIGELLNEKINWKSVLYKYVTNSLPQDFSYSRPSRRGIASEIYLPHIKKENIEVVVSVDTSGSIDQEELTEFMSEIIYLAKSFDNLKMKVIICDCSIKEVLEVENGNIEKLINLKIVGGGGTSHKPIYDMIQEKYPTTKILINFTDGYTDFPNNETTKTLWVIPEGGVEDDKIPFGDIVRLLK